MLLLCKATRSSVAFLGKVGYCMETFSIPNLGLSGDALPEKYVSMDCPPVLKFEPDIEPVNFVDLLDILFQPGP